MKSRKTIAVEDLKATINDSLRDSVDRDQGGREALMNLLENILHDTGNYNGFGYLSAESMEKSVSGVSVGIGPFVSGSVEDLRARFDNTDHTRVVFF